MQVEIWSDVVCPWCYIGKRRFEAALARFEHADEVTVTWRAFELDPSAPVEREGKGAEHLARKYGLTVERAEEIQADLTATAAAEGLDFHVDVARGGNTFDAHRVIHLATERGLGDAVKERLMLAYFTEGEPIGQAEAVARVAVEAGLDATEVADVLGSDRFADEVRLDEEVARQLGISGVPFFVLDRKYGVSGAQPADALLAALEQAWGDRQPVAVAAGAAGATCDDGSCAV